MQSFSEHLFNSCYIHVRTVQYNHRGHSKSRDFYKYTIVVVGCGGNDDGRVDRVVSNLFARLSYARVHQCQRETS
jgi:hypothetical protein